MHGNARATSPSLLMLFRLIVVALLLVATTFVGVLLLFGFRPSSDAPFFGNLLTYTATAIGLIAVAINVVLSIVTRKYLSRSEGGSGVVMLGVSTIGGAMVFAFAAFFAATSMMLEQSWGALVLVIAMIGGIASRFPLK